jgi:hypothetical protein
MICKESTLRREIVGNYGAGCGRILLEELRVAACENMN